MKKRLALLTMLVALLSVVPIDDIPVMMASKCCADYCGGDKNCYKWCTHDPSGPCSSEAVTQNQD